jgi:GAF domain-containing protein
VEGNYIVGMWLDITARKYGEEALLKVKEELESEAARREDELKQVRAQLGSQLQELKQVKHEAHLLSQMEEMLQTCLEVEEVYAVFTKFAGELFPREAGAVYVFDPAKADYHLTAVWGKSAPAVKRFAWDDCWSLRLQQAHLVAKRDVRMRCHHVKAESPYVCAPPKVAGLAIGVLNILMTEESYTEDKAMAATAALAQDAAGRLGMALYNLRLREILKNK